ncbi:MAG: GntR family transcriptional regulator [Spirochaetes bacterium]|nr:GntR family transcriptional regulator [Spirochaetota bacterium]
MLNYSSPLPLYQQLADIIQSKIENGEYKVGEKIPAENNFAQQYNVGRPTVRQATDILVQQKVLQRKKGSGTYVLPIKKEIDLFTLGGTSSALEKTGTKTETQVIESMKKIPITGPADHPFYQQKPLYFSRLQKVNQIPIIFEKFYLHDELFLGLEKKDLNNVSLSKIIKEQYYLVPEMAKQYLAIYQPDFEIQKLLQTKQPVLQLKRYIHFKENENAIYVLMYCRTDQYEFCQTIFNQ